MPEEPASPPSSIAKCDRRLDPIFKKATRRNPALRFQSADEMADDLEKVLPNIGASGQKAVRTAADRKAPCNDAEASDDSRYEFWREGIGKAQARLSC
jgi:hypothetical protein